jgi:hypothetical protein
LWDLCWRAVQWISMTPFRAHWTLFTFKANTYFTRLNTIWYYYNGRSRFCCFLWKNSQWSLRWHGFNACVHWSQAQHLENSINFIVRTSQPKSCRWRTLVKPLQRFWQRRPNWTRDTLRNGSALVQHKDTSNMTVTSRPSFYLIHMQLACSKRYSNSTNAFLIKFNSWILITVLHLACGKWRIQLHVSEVCRLPSLAGVLPDLMNAFQHGGGVEYQKYGKDCVDAVSCSPLYKLLIHSRLLEQTDLYTSTCPSGFQRFPMWKQVLNQVEPL